MFKSVITTNDEETHRLKSDSEYEFVQYSFINLEYFQSKAIKSSFEQVDVLIPIWRSSRVFKFNFFLSDDTQSCG